eukprot:scaffold416504_cov40-Prasinocladus_malaysianus.AAC.2
MLHTSEKISRLSTVSTARSVVIGAVDNRPEVVAVSYECSSDRTNSCCINGAMSASSSRMVAVTRLESCVGLASETSRRTNLRHTGTRRSKSLLMRVLTAAGRASGRAASQLATRGCQPSSLGSRYTMPHRETVAGDATA